MFATLIVRVTLIREKASCNKVVQFNPIVSYVTSMGLIFIRLNKKAKVKRILVAAKKNDVIVRMGYNGIPREKHSW